MHEETGTERLEVVVRDNPEEQRYEAILDGTVAGIATYELRDGVMVFPHTVVPPEWEGRGVADQIVHFALDDVRARGLQALPGLLLRRRLGHAPPRLHRPRAARRTAAIREAPPGLRAGVVRRRARGRR